ncbi:MAG: SRPBCC family protein [Geminicoccaceae bacterium]
MATSATAIIEAAAPDLVITRVFEAPPDLVFQAWTEGEHLVHWSAPHGFTITHGEGDVRPGGVWRCCMRSPDGAEHWLGGVYREVDEPERLVFTHVWEDEGRPGHQTLVTVTFAEQEGKTKLTFQQAGFESVASRDAHEAGWTGCLDRLAGYLATV